MKALILAGGFGTRLRPLTLTQAKPLVEFANKPMVLHQMEALAAAGVDTVIFAANHKLGEYLESFMKEQEKRIETEPLGTAGPLALAKPFLKNDEFFFLLNSDVIADFPFSKMLEFHRSHGHEGTIAVTKVADPSKYGVVMFNEKSGQIEAFVEKPKEYVGNKINAGMYILNTSVLDRIPLGIACSIENQVFPSMVESENLFAYPFKGFWMDVGQPKDFLKGMKLYLEHQQNLGESAAVKLSTGTNIIPPVLIDSSAQIGDGVSIGPNVVIGANVRIENGVRVQNSTFLSDSIIGTHSYITSCIVGRKCTIGRWVRIENECVIGEDVVVNDELYINGAQVLPHKSITVNIPEPRIIM